jgi:hypothetical protein
MNPEQIERGLTSESFDVRWKCANNTAFTFNSKQIERGLTDEAPGVRWAFAKRTDYTPTFKQIERGQMDEEWRIRKVFQEKQAEWRAKWESEELKSRHACAVTTKPKVEAL